MAGLFPIPLYLLLPPWPLTLQLYVLMSCKHWLNENTFDISAPLISVNYTPCLQLSPLDKCVRGQWCWMVNPKVNRVYVCMYVILKCKENAVCTTACKQFFFYVWPWHLNFIIRPRTSYVATYGVRLDKWSIHSMLRCTQALSYHFMWPCFLRLWLWPSKFNQTQSLYGQNLLSMQSCTQELGIGRQTETAGQTDKGKAIPVLVHSGYI